MRYELGPQHVQDPLDSGGPLGDGGVAGVLGLPRYISSLVNMSGSTGMRNVSVSSPTV